MEQPVGISNMYGIEHEITCTQLKPKKIMLCALCHGHISCDALPDELATSFAYNCIHHPAHTSRTVMALWWRWEIWASLEGITGFNHSLNILGASSMSDAQMRHCNHVPEPLGGCSQHRRVALQQQDVSGPRSASGTSVTLCRFPDHWVMVVRWVDDGTEGGSTAMYIL